jgi:hypothetical protein
MCSEGEERTKTPIKALFITAETPYKDFGDIIQIARAEACRILGCSKIKILNILPCNYPKGYVAVVQKPGGKEGKVENKRENSETG